MSKAKPKYILKPKPKPAPILINIDELKKIEMDH